MDTQGPAPINRLEDDQLVRGAGTFVDDIKLTGMLHAVVVRSLHARALIVAIDVRAAEATAGVAGIFTAATLTGLVNEIPPIEREDVVFENAPGHPVLADGSVGYVGQPVAIAVAEDRYAAQDAASRVVIDYEPLPPVLDPRVAAETPANVAFRVRAGRGDVEASLGAADRVVRARFDVPRVVATPLEGRGVVARYEPDARALTLWTSTQVPHRVKQYLEKLLDPRPAEIRVIGPDVGGGFGQKGEVFPEEMAMSFIAMTLGRPVKWIEERSENMIAYHGRGFTADVEAGVNDDGLILGMRYRIWADLGAYLLTFTAAPSHNVTQRVAGPYAVPNMDVECVGVLTNKSPTGPYRGAGGPEAAVFTERMVDLVAAELGMDPVEVRRRNFIPADAFPYTTTTDLTYDSGDFAAAFDRALELADYRGWREAQGASRAEGRLVGIGMATVVKASGGKGLARNSNAIVRIETTGEVTLITEISAIGQGTHTSLAQIAAAELGVSPADVRVLNGDTDLLAWGLGTFASRGLAVGGSAVLQGVRRAREKITTLAAHLLDCSPGEIVLAGSRASSAELPDKSVTLAEVAVAAADERLLPKGMDPGLEFHVDFTLPANPFSFAAHVVVIEVDPGSGEVRILRYVAVHDCGPFLNPIIARGQIHGGIAQGIGQAFSEGMAYDADGLVLTANLMTYGVPAALDVPPIVAENMATPSPTNPLGVKGIGELPTVAAPAAIANALTDALAPLGASRVDLPLSPEKVWRAVHEGKRAG